MLNNKAARTSAVVILSFAILITLSAIFINQNFVNQAQTNPPTSQTWQNFVQSKASGVEPILPDYSYAGYRRMQTRIPRVDHPVFDVTTYGAIPNDDVSDEQAIRDAVSAAQDYGRGIVFFPRGRFVVDSKDSIRITQSNIVLRGSGSELGGTEIFQKNFLDPSNPDAMYSTPHKFDFRPAAVAETDLTTITEDAARETFWVMVADSSRLSVNQRIKLEMHSPNLEPYIEPYDLSSGWTRGMRVSEKHQIAEISGRRVRFYEPLHIDVKASEGYKVRTHTVIEEVGVEDIAFIGNWHGNFVHHKNALHDSGWSLLALNNVTNGWVLRCRFWDANEMLEINNSSLISVLQARMGGTPGHFATSGGGNYGVLYGLIKLESPVFHGASLQWSATGTVMWRYAMHKDVNWDTHATCPYANLVDASSGRFGTANNGGDKRGLPNHLRWFTIWNYKNIGSSRSDFNWWTGSHGSFVLPIVVGLHGNPVAFRNANQMEILESNGTKVAPESLFEAQLAHRLGAVPNWLTEMKNQWTTPMPTPTPTPTVTPTPTLSCKTAAANGSWVNTGFASQTNTFTAEFDAKPSRSPLNGVIGLSDNAQNAFTGFAALVRFNESGNIDARDGGTYSAASTIPYAANTNYHFRMRINVSARTYSVYVQPDDGNERLIGRNFEFRTEQNIVSNLNSWGVYINSTSGSVSVCNFKISSGTIINPLADAYVRDGFYASSNFGDATGLLLKQSGSSDFNRMAYLKFNLPGADNIREARLRLYGSLTDTRAINVAAEVYSSSNTTWSEIGINWNNKPAPNSASALAQTTITDNVARWYEWDVTNYLRAEKAAGRNTVTLLLKTPDLIDPLATFRSREAGSNAPQLIIE